MPSQRVMELCNADETVTRAQAERPTTPVKHTRKRLFGSGKPGAKAEQAKEKGEEKEEDVLRSAERCGKFPYTPSELFLKVYNDALGALDADPLSNMVSPSLSGSSGVIPLSIVSVIPDIMRHYADLIVRAETEVFLATNYWEPSHSSTIISDSLRELSKRVAKRNGEKVVVKLMYDRGSLSQLRNNHVYVLPKDWKAVNLPTEDELPGVALEVVNFHRPALGTFHAKYLIVDRKVACINSNNIQDRPNVEMMVHLEGPIVDSFYDMALLSWSNAMNPPLPLLGHETVYPEEYKFNHENGHLKYINQEATSKATREYLKKQHTLNEAEMEDLLPWARRFTLGPHNTNTDGEQIDAETADRQRKKFLAEHPNMMVPHASATNMDAVEEGEEGRGGGSPSSGSGSGSTSSESGTATPTGSAGERDGEVVANGLGNANGHGNGVEAEKPAAGPSNGSAHTAGDATPLAEEPKPLADEPKPLSADPSPLDPHDSPSDAAAEPGTNPHAIDSHTASTTASIARAHRPHSHSVSSSSVTAADVAKRLNIGKVQLDATVEDAGVADFQPYILHRAHAPCPIAMVNRKPSGKPGHRADNPQDLAWLSAVRNARKSIFVQTPTFNAAPLIPATLDACRRGVEVTLFLDLGFNDQGEQIPFQGGTNEMVVHRMYRKLNAEKRGHEKNLKVYWYTGKDQHRPISAAAKKRNCHVKFMAVDDQIAIFGNGNQDTQSWFHSMEINVLVDSPPLVREWLAGISANQNTAMYGRVSDADGIWRDGDEVLQASGVKPASVVTWGKSIAGATEKFFSPGQGPAK
ncbi:unnamed protein product [Peniophora sp. CBMAI 1063]|nr:unnamed protein product [Peniophora sp. CBMAI 1063]